MQEKHPAYGESFTGKQINRKFFRTLAYHTIPPVEDECFSDKLMKTQKTFDIGSRTVHNIRVFLNEKLLLPEIIWRYRQIFCSFSGTDVHLLCRYFVLLQGIVIKKIKKKEDFFK